MKTLNIIQNTALSLMTLFVWSSLIRVVIHILKTHNFQWMDILYLGFVFTFMGFLSYMLGYILIGVWRESLKK